MPFDLEFWKQWEGERIDAGFPLERCIGAGPHGAVFETQFQGEPAAIKLIPGTPKSQTAASRSHPALVSTLAQGETALAETRCAYTVMERADENLAEVLAERPLTPAETREMLLPLLDALRYLHSQGFEHGRLKPANIMAFGEQLKISSDGLIAGGDPAADCTAIGVLLEQVLGASRNARLPEPFAKIVGHCLTSDPSGRWDVARIEACLRGDSAPASSPAQSRAIWWGLAAAAALIAGLFALWPPPAPGPVAKAVPFPDIVDTKPSPLPPPVKAPEKVETKASTEQRPAGVDGITRVLPEIPQAALNTITGLVRINVRVRVDSAGNVSQAILEPPAVSKYFSDRALAAARSWKFPAGDGPRDWGLHFDLTREQTRVSLARIAN
jgi:serine/threonine protein kinase